MTDATARTDPEEELRYLERRITMTLSVALASCLQIAGLGMPWARYSDDTREAGSGYLVWTLPQVLDEYSSLVWLTRVNW